MHILLVSQYWLPENGVPQRRWAWLTGLLTAAGHRVTVLAPPPHYRRDVDPRTWARERSYRTAADFEEGPHGERILRTAFMPTGESLTSRSLGQLYAAAGQAAAALRVRCDSRDSRGSRHGGGATPVDVVVGTVPALPTALVTPMIARLLGVPYGIDLRDPWPDLIAEADRFNEATGRASLRERVLRSGPLQVVRPVATTAMRRALRGATALAVTSSSFAGTCAASSTAAARRCPRCATSSRRWSTPAHWERSGRMPALTASRCACSTPGPWAAPSASTTCSRPPASPATSSARSSSCASSAPATAARRMERMKNFLCVVLVMFGRSPDITPGCSGGART
ncbi:hypothetical protein [Corynebacterium frankenforstense]